MADFPTLSIDPSVEGWQEELVFDNVLRTGTEGGYVTTRPRYTRSPKKWTLKYDAAPTADKVLMQAFESSINGNKFNWTNPSDSVSYEVRLAAGVITYTPHDTINLWDFTVTLEGV